MNFVWAKKENTAFNKMKEKLTSDPVLVLPDLRKAFTIHCDFCGNSIGAVLMQEGSLPMRVECCRMLEKNCRYMRKSCWL